MLSEIPKEIQAAIDAGITVVAGEVEEVWGKLLRDAYEGRLEPVYNFLDRKPSLAGVPGPVIPFSIDINSFHNRQTSFDAGRGCPFSCSFCTIINVQGRQMRGRRADDIEELVRKQYARGINHYFVTDDNFSRHKDWETIADRLIDLKENHGMRLSLKIQVDTMAHKIPRFVEKMAHAGVRRVFIGLESVNAKNLKAVGKHHNQIREYRQMFQTWRNHGILTFAGYMIGFPGDTYESVMKDVAYLKRELCLEHPLFFIVTPLPGSADHQDLVKQSVPLEEDCNLYDTMHACIDTPKMTRSEIERCYQDAWKSFYSDEHLRTILLRRKGPRRRILVNSLFWMCANSQLDRLHPFLGGIFRRKGRRQRRPGMPIEPFLVYYFKRARELFFYTLGMMRLYMKLRWFQYEADRPQNQDYIDDAINPANELPSSTPKNRSLDFEGVGGGSTNLA